MKKIIQYLLNGLLVLLPIVATVYVFMYVFNFVDDLGQNMFFKITGYSIPVGLGLILTLIVITLIGMISQLWVSKKILGYFEKMILRFPGLKTVYNLVKETIESFVGDKRSFSKVVLITEEDGAKRIGFLTTENVTMFYNDPEYVAIYVPHGLQVSGELKLYHKDKITYIDVPVEDAMKFCFTGGVSSTKK